MKGYNLSQLTTFSHQEIILPEPFGTFIGKPEKSFHTIVWGPAGQGKSLWLLQLAAQLSHSGKVGYFPVEEGRRKTFKEKITLLGLGSGKVEKAGNFMVYMDRTPEDIFATINSKHVRHVFIDSVNEAGITADMMQDWRAQWGKRKSVHVIRKSAYQDKSEWNFNADTTVECVNLVAHTRKNRNAKLSRMAVLPGALPKTLFTQEASNG